MVMEPVLVARRGRPARGRARWWQREAGRRGGLSQCGGGQGQRASGDGEGREQAQAAAGLRMLIGFLSPVCVISGVFSDRVTVVTIHVGGLRVSLAPLVVTTVITIAPQYAAKLRRRCGGKIPVLPALSSRQPRCP